jgi:hypothetical protein
MPVPISTILRPDLAATFMEFDVMAAQAAMIGPKVFPFLDVMEKSSHFGKIPIEALLTEPQTRRQPKGDYGRADFEFDQVTYTCDEHGWEEVVDDDLLKQYRYIFDAEQVASMRALGIVMRSFEKRIADAVFNTTTWTGAPLTTAITNEWDDATNATPIADVTAAKKLVRENSGLIADTVIMDWSVFQNLRNVDEIIDRIKYSGHTDPKAAAMSPIVIAEVFDVRQVLVAGAGGVRNSANPGAAATPAPIWSDEYAMICKVASTQDMQEPCVGRTFNWSEDSDQNLIVEEYREEKKRGSIIRVRHSVDELVLYAEAGHLLSNITT